MIFIFNWATLRFHVDFPGCFHNLKRNLSVFGQKKSSWKTSQIKENPYLSWQLTHLRDDFFPPTNRKQALKTGYIFPPSRERPIPPIGFPRGVLCVVLMVEVGQGHLPRKQRYLGVKAHDAHTPCALAWPVKIVCWEKLPEKCLGFRWSWMDIYI